MPRERGRGKGRGRDGNASRSLNEEFATASTSSELELVRKAGERDIKNINKLTSGDKKRLIAAKRKKEMSRLLLPDAPSNKARKNNCIVSPIRNPWRLVEGPPSTLPSPKKQPWQRGDESPQRRQSPAISNVKTPTSRFQDQFQAPNSGSSISSYIEVPTLSPCYWRHGVDVDVKIEPVDYVPESEKSQIVNDATEIRLGLSSPPPEEATSSNNDFEIFSEPRIENGCDSNPEEPEPWEPETFVSREVANPNSAILPDNIDPSLRRLLDESDKLNDIEIRQMVSPDLLTFDWKNEAEHFKGKREMFTGCVGPTQSVKDLHPVDVFLKIWDTEIIDIIVKETNVYANQVISSTNLKQHSRLKTWTPTDRQEILTFFAFLIYQGVAPLPVEKDYFKTTGRLAIPGLAQIMPYNRLLLLKKFLHFNSEPPQNFPAEQRQIHKLGRIPNYLNSKFSGMYLPDQNIAIDESLLNWSGRLTISQKIANKAAKVGIKTYELCESSTGYLWSFIIYCGADKTRQTGQDEENRHDHQDELTRPDGQDGRTGDNEPDGYTAKVVYQLATPLFGKGHTLVMDNFYNSPLLARCLKTKQTDVVGTLRISREFVPQSLKSVTKTELRVGEVVYSQTFDLTVFVWRDANLVSMISTYHPVEIGAKEKYGSWRYKPQAVLDYNSLMGGVDKKDQLLAAFPMERIRNQVWYKKLFRRLLNVSILNAQIIHAAHNNKVAQRQFRIVLAEELIARFQSPKPSSTEVKVLDRQKVRPVLSGNHYIIKGPSRHASCVWCRRNKKLTRTVFKCEQCSLSLCLDSCFKEYHTVPC